VEWAIDGMVVCALDNGTVCGVDEGTVVCALNDSLSLLFFLHLEVDIIAMIDTVEVSAVAGDMI